jgi:excisionase family DNA binding protein
VTTARAPEREWLALGSASRLLGVDPDTLRRWADAGRVEAFTTPGGHRRFSRAALDDVRRARRSESMDPVAGRSLARLGVTPERLSEVYRRSYGTRAVADSATNPRALVRPPDREPYRQGGRRLVGVLLAYLDAPDGPTRNAAEAAATELTADLARRIAGGGISLTEGVGLFVAGRRPLLSELGALARRQGLGSAQLARLYEAASGLLDRLLLVFIATHQSASTVDDTPIARIRRSTRRP